MLVWCTCFTILYHKAQTENFAKAAYDYDLNCHLGLDAWSKTGTARAPWPQPLPQPLPQPWPQPWPQPSHSGYKDKFDALGIWYEHRLIDDMVAQVAFNFTLGVRYYSYPSAFKLCLHESNPQESNRENYVIYRHVCLTFFKNVSVFHLVK